MYVGCLRSGWLLAVALAATGCAGNGQGLDQNGQPITAGSVSGGGEVTPDLASIEANVFTPICSKCHVGASAPEGLQLDAAHAYDFLVGVPSVEEPNLERVNPGNPNLSYMLMKIEGAPGIEGGQMPLGETPLPQATIAAISQWIANGAPNVASTSAVNKTFDLKETSPADGSAQETPPRQLMLLFTGQIDASLVNETTVSLHQIAPEGGVDVRVHAELKVVDENPSVLMVRPRTALAPGAYRLSLRAEGGGGLADVNAKTLGRDVSIVFTVGNGQ